MSIHGSRFTSHVLILYTVGQDGVSLQAFVAQVDGLVVGILIIKDEQVGVLLLYGLYRKSLEIQTGLTL